MTVNNSSDLTDDKNEGLILLNKSRGFTSFDEINRLKRKLNIKKAGHAGTLDKEAEGLLLVCTGKSTKLLKFLTGMDKVYEAEFTFGEQRSTDDIAGEVINSYSGEINLKSVESFFDKYRGIIKQTPPDYSAVHVNGKRAYKIALNGEKPEIKSREVNIKLFELIEVKDNKIKVRIECSSGTYIRSIARDLGIDTGYYAYMSNLRRISIGDFKIEDSSSISDGSFKIFSPSQIMSFMEEIIISDEAFFKVKNGIKLKSSDFIDIPDHDGFFKVMADNNFSAVIIKNGDSYKYDLVY